MPRPCTVLYATLTFGLIHDLCMVRFLGRDRRAPEEWLLAQACCFGEESRCGCEIPVAVLYSTRGRESGPRPASLCRRMCSTGSCGSQRATVYLAFPDSYQTADLRSSSAQRRGSDALSSVACIRLVRHRLNPRRSISLSEAVGLIALSDESEYAGPSHPHTHFLFFHVVVAE